MKTRDWKAMETGLDKKVFDEADKVHYIKMVDEVDGILKNLAAKIAKVEIKLKGWYGFTRVETGEKVLIVRA